MGGAEGGPGGIESMGGAEGGPGGIESMGGAEGGPGGIESMGGAEGGPVGWLLEKVGGPEGHQEVHRTHRVVEQMQVCLRPCRGQLVKVDLAEAHP